MDIFINQIPSIKKYKIEKLIDDDEKKKLQQENKNLKQHINDLNDEIETLKNINEMLQQENNELKQNINNLDKKIDDVLKNFETSKNTNTNKMLKNINAQNPNKIEILYQEIEKLKNDFDVIKLLDQEILKLEQEIKFLNEKINEWIYDKNGHFLDEEKKIQMINYKKLLNLYQDTKLKKEHIKYMYLTINNIYELKEKKIQTKNDLKLKKGNANYLNNLNYFMNELKKKIIDLENENEEKKELTNDEIEKLKNTFDSELKEIKMTQVAQQIN